MFKYISLIETLNISACVHVHMFSSMFHCVYVFNKPTVFKPHLRKCINIRTFVYNAAFESKLFNPFPLPLLFVRY